MPSPVGLACLYHDTAFKWQTPLRPFVGICRCVASDAARRLQPYHNLSARPVLEALAPGVAV